MVITILADKADLFIKACEKCHVKCHVLGGPRENGKIVFEVWTREHDVHSAFADSDPVPWISLGMEIQKGGMI